ncbi:MAG TPA: metallophosphoesterase family protein [Candidatus Methylomirabilis sp.]|nr:metallophosphoesterase family protein [Candidatus Methylomirabilis sp.]
MSGRLVGLISDTHGLLRPEAIRALQGSDLIIHAGDVGKEAVLTDLQVVAPVTAVRGNVDREVWAHRLPRTEALEIEQVRVYVIHDVKELDLIPEAAGFKVVISGHSHRPSIHERQGVIFVNPGSAGPRRFNVPVSLARMSVQDASVEVELVTLDV